MTGWTWDETLYAGSAEYYRPGRMPYPPALAETLRAELGLDGTGRLLDVGCGPGSLTLLLAPHFATAVGIDADPGMLIEADRHARDRNITHVQWRQLRAEELPAGLGRFRVACFAQSFHWMDRPVVARAVRGMLQPDGVWVHVSATTHRGDDSDDPLPLPRPPWDDVQDLIFSYLGPVRRAGQSTLPTGTVGNEEVVMREAGFTVPKRIDVPGGRIVERTVDDIVASVFSLSGSAPHLFGSARDRFEADLRRLLRTAAHGNRFCERTHDIALAIWHP